MPSLFALQVHLRNCDAAERVLTVSSVHDLAGDDFPDDARECSFWANDAASSTTWRKIGFVVESRDWPAKVLRFTRFDSLAEGATPFVRATEAESSPFTAFKSKTHFENPLIGVWYGKLKPAGLRRLLPQAREPIAAGPIETGQLLLGFDFIIKSALGYSIAPIPTSDTQLNPALPLLISEVTAKAIADECRGGKLDGVGDPAYMYQLLYTREGVQELRTPAKAAMEAGNIYRSGGTTRACSELLAVAKAHDLTIVTNEPDVMSSASKLGIKHLNF